MTQDRIEVEIIARNAAKAVLAEFRNDVTQTGRSVSGLRTNVTQAFNVMAGTLGAQAVAKVASLGFSAVKAGFEFNNLKQQAMIAFTTMLKDGKAAEKFLFDLEKFAARTPFEFTDLTRGAQRMMAMGFSAKEVLPTLTAIGDAVAGLGGSGAVIDQVTRALGQMQAKGKTSSQEMMQLTEAGIPAWKYLAEAIGVSVPEAMKKVESGSVSAGQTIKAVTQGMQREFGGMMDAQSRTFGGMMSTLKDTWAQVSGQVMKPFFDLAIRGMKNLIDLIESDGFKNGVKDFAAGLESTVNIYEAGFEGSIIPGLKWLIANRPVLYGIGAALAGGFLLLNPIFAVGGLIAVGIGLIGLMRTRSEELDPALLNIKIRFLEIAETIEDAWQQVDQLAAKINTLGGILPKGSSVLKMIPGVGQLYGAYEAANQVSRWFGGAGAPSSTAGGKPYDQMSSIERQLFDAYQADRNNSGNVHYGSPEEEWAAAMETMREEAAAAATGPIPEFTDSIGDAGGAAKAAAKEVDILQDGVISLAEALEYGLTPAEAGAMEATRMLADEQYRAEERAFELAKAIAGLQTSAAQGTQAFQTFVNKMVDGALELQRQAAGAIFGRPSQEEARKQLDIARVEEQIARRRLELQAGDTGREVQLVQLERRLADLKSQEMGARGTNKVLLGGQVDSVEAEIQRLRNFTDPQLEALEKQRDAMQQELALLEARNRVMQAELTLADQTLLTDHEQEAMTRILIDQTRELSGLYRISADTLGLTMIPAFDEATQAAYRIRDAFNAAAGAMGGQPAYAQGTSFVPNTGPALLHQGEMVIPAQIAAVIRSVMGDGGSRLNNYGVINNIGAGGEGGDPGLDYALRRF